MKRPRTLAEQIADLDDPAPKDFDPEEHGEPGNSEEESASDVEGFDGREHYVEVGKSKLRKPEETPLGHRYSGSRIDRGALLEDESDDDPFAAPAEASLSGDESNDEHPSTGDSDRDERPDSATTSEDEESPSDISSDEDDAMDRQSPPHREPTADRAALRAMMAESQKAVVASISKAAKEDAIKGRAIKRQRQTFDTFLNVRIRLQKALIATNTLPTLPPDSYDPTSSEHEMAFEAAEAAALNLWNQLNELRQTLSELNESTSIVKSKDGQSNSEFMATKDTEISTLITEMERQEASALPQRRTILEKWSAKARGASSNPVSQRLNNTAHQQTITDVIATHLSGSNRDRLIKRTKLPRSCAPVQAAQMARDKTAAEQDVEGIYDDADFYQLLLKELVEQRMADSSLSAKDGGDPLTDTALNGNGLLKGAKTRRKVDTKASKGRKLRYTVHEKLQNFMAQEDRGTWGDKQRDELFGSLLGARGTLLREDDGSDEDEMDVSGWEPDGGEAGLRLF